MPTQIHPTALVDKSALLGDGVCVGAFSIVEAGVKIGAGTLIGHHCVLAGPTEIGERNRISNFCSFGAPPQDLGYKGDPTKLVIGNENFFGDYVQLSRGTTKNADLTTRIGNNCFLMAYCHVGHDCVLGDRIIAANAVQLAGHVKVEDKVVFGGTVAIHQFCRVGKMAMVSGGSVTSLDIPPYTRVGGWGCAVFGLNLIGLERNGYSKAQIRRIREAYKVLFRSDVPYEKALASLESDFKDCEPAQHWVRFFRESDRGVVRERENK
ncbi:acyl-ACP--UDP-N-acetylglucosamine O-acyltransferase [bacterium]|nr:MAG: acyl-ACP--UDP-N-acetylglucosamine O-acyltransferase [bacterium]RIK64391.1 MAG: acyl-[acyl-carrier-protein]--UDP-N-acetylglucosamine O-acyltransferase [Planctomycetota bacterium]